ncbi:hypothetical protein TRFO_42028 [Tritrichomonas foetus]|uniref:Uncharacterized protein n=1 Tax=Tritrichomonas foetus TaxID=1144522 RepID=A0A1J4L2I5_9EUKA|nr:hypothetical protein TRFO_42028 [Tritrichomonas foetus]|eukprot:OHT16158.1 hypothetical protein TRFO_42028 [Tritrichomonas foetus]
MMHVIQVNAENLRAITKQISLSTSYFDILILILNRIIDDAESNEDYFLENYELAQVLFKETFPSFFDYLLDKQDPRNIVVFIRVYILLSNQMCMSNLYDFIPFMSEILLKSNGFSEKLPLIEYYDSEFMNIRPKVNINTFNKIFINCLVNSNILQSLILLFPTFESFDDFLCSSIFKIFLSVFQNIRGKIIFYEIFQNYEFSIDDPRFNSLESLNLTKSMSFCSPQYYQLHFDNIIHFLVQDNINKNVKIELVRIMRRRFSDNIINSFIDSFDVIVASLRNDFDILESLSNILISKFHIDSQFIFDKIGLDLNLNICFFDCVVPKYTAEIVSKIINTSNNYDENVVKFIFKVMNYNFDLLENPISILKQSIKYWNDDHFQIIELLSKNDKYRKYILKAFENCEDENYQTLLIITDLISLLKPEKEEFNFDVFINSFLYNMDSIFILPFYINNDFLPIVDLELLMEFVPFSNQLGNLIIQRCENIQNYLDFLLCHKCDSQEYNDFLFILYLKTNDYRIIWELVIRSNDSNDDFHEIAQNIINTDSKIAQKQITEKVLQGFHGAFLNFDFSSFDEIAINNENKILLLFNKPYCPIESINENKIEPNNENIFYYATKIKYYLNHQLNLENTEIFNLCNFEDENIVIESLVANIFFDAVQQYQIKFDNFSNIIEKYFFLSLNANHKKFLQKLIPFIKFNLNCQILRQLFDLDKKSCIILINQGRIDNTLLEFFKQKKAMEIIHNCHFPIPLSLLKEMNFSKKDFIQFLKDKRIKINEILSIVFSYDFPETCRTKQLLKYVFSSIQTNPIIFYDFLSKSNYKPPTKRFSQQSSITNSQFYSLYQAFSYILPDLNRFSQSTTPDISQFFADVSYSHYSNIESPFNEMNADINSLINDIFSEFSYEYIKLFESSFIAYDSVVYNTLPFEVQELFISDYLKTFRFIQTPKIFCFRILCKNWNFEKSFIINGQTYILGCFIAKSLLFISKLNQYLEESINNKPNKDYFVTMKNGSKGVAYPPNEITSPELAFYFNESYFNELVQNKHEKCRTSHSSYEPKYIIQSALFKTDFEWNQWKVDETLYKTCNLLISQFDYYSLFESLSSNKEYSLYFFSNLSSMSHNSNLDELLDSKAFETLVNTYPNHNSLFQILLLSLQTKTCNNIVFKSLEILKPDEFNQKNQNIPGSLSQNIDNNENNDKNIAITIAKMLVDNQHTENIAKLFSMLHPCQELHEYFEWIEYSLTSSNKSIRDHGISLIMDLYQPEDHPKLTQVLQNTLYRSIYMKEFSIIKKFVVGYFGFDFAISRTFSAKMYDKIFKQLNYPSYLDQVIAFLDLIPPPPIQNIKEWIYYLSQNISNNVALILCGHIFSLIFRAKYQPAVNELNIIISNLIQRADFSDMEKIFILFSRHLQNDNICDYFALICEMEKIIVYYVPFIDNLFRFPSFVESDLIFLAAFLPITVYLHENSMNTFFPQFNRNESIIIHSITIANSALNLILSGKCTKVSAKANMMSAILNKFYFPKFKQVIFYKLVSSLEIVQVELLEYIRLCSLAFRELLVFSIEQITNVDGYNLFHEKLGIFSSKWANICCEFAREVFSDISLQYLSKTVLNLVHREANCQLFYYNSIEKTYLKFIIAALQQNLEIDRIDQIFSALRNKENIDDVLKMIELSIQRYGARFFNAEEIKNFILNIDIKDTSIGNKLEFIKFLLIHAGNKMSTIMDEIFPVIENLVSELPQEYEPIADSILEQSLLLMSC